MNWVDLAQDKDRRRVIAFHERRGILWLGERLLASHE